MGLGSDCVTSPGPKNRQVTGFQETSTVHKNTNHVSPSWKLLKIHFKTYELVNSETNCENCFLKYMSSFLTKYSLNDKKIHILFSERNVFLHTTVHGIIVKYSRIF